jgi:hypothetical protein
LKSGAFQHFHSQVRASFLRRLFCGMPQNNPFQAQNLINYGASAPPLRLVYWFLDFCFIGASSPFPLLRSSKPNSQAKGLGWVKTPPAPPWKGGGIQTNPTNSGQERELSQVCQTPPAQTCISFLQNSRDVYNLWQNKTN